MDTFKTMNTAPSDIPVYPYYECSTNAGTWVSINGGTLPLKNYNELVAAVSEVNAKLMQAQSAGLLAQEKQSALSHRVAELEREIRDLKRWESEADCYQLSEVAKGVYALTPKPGMERGEPQHMLCAHCAGDKQKSILQLNSDTAARTVYLCHRCKNELHFGKLRNPTPINRTPGGPQGWMAR